MFSSAQTWVDTPEQQLSWGREIVKRVAVLGQSFSVGETISPLNPVAWVGVILLGFILVWMAINWRKLEIGAWQLLLALVIIIPPNLVFNIITRYPQSAPQALPHRILYAYPFFMLLIAYGISLLKNKWTVIVLSGLLIVFGLGIFNYFANRQFMAPNLSVPWRQVMENIRENASEGSVVVCSESGGECKYYATEYGFSLSGLSSWQNEDSPPPEIWWIQINLGDSFYASKSDKEQLDAISNVYRTKAVFDYGLHDPSIRWIKTKLFGQTDYSYRVNLYWFVK
jgi:hypothetical protein